MQTALPQPLKHRRGHGVELKVVRNGSRGAFGLEPLVEVEMDAERIAFGAVKVSDVPSIIESLETGAHSHERYLGPTTEIPWFEDKHVLRSSVAVSVYQQALKIIRRLEAIKV